eukprot:c4654_g1_i1.p1 GENE.c4654_g1_i1~~c4654_g1_i1.p1  ORF type:complete len:543 (-),score=134.31 c4654_g1_i1:355-1983(-)
MLFAPNLSSPTPLSTAFFCIIAALSFSATTIFFFLFPLLCRITPPQTGNILFTPYNNQNINATIASCVLLANPVPFHSEVQIALHSYILAAGYSVCLFHKIDEKELGYSNWFRPPPATTITLKSFDQLLSLAEKKVAGRTKTLFVATVTREMLLADNKKESRMVHFLPRTFAIVHEPIQESQAGRLRLKDFVLNNWTIAFLSPTVKENWDAGRFYDYYKRDTNNFNFNNKKPDRTPHTRSLSFVPVWQSTTSFFTNPFIHNTSSLSITPTTFPSFLDWSEIFQTIDEHLDWFPARGRITNPAKRHTIQLTDLAQWRYIVVQGIFHSHRRDYNALFDWITKTNLTTTHPNFKLIMIGRLQEDDIREFGISNHLFRQSPKLQQQVLLFPKLNHLQYSLVIEHARGVFPAQKIGDMTYVTDKCSSTVPTALSHAIPILGDLRVRAAYGELVVMQGVVEFRNSQIRQLTGLGVEDSKIKGVVRPGLLQEDSISTFDTFDQAVEWLISLSSDEFASIRRQVMAVRDTLFDQNTQMVVDEIQRSQTIQ